MFKNDDGLNNIFFQKYYSYLTGILCFWFFSMAQVQAYPYGVVPSGTSTTDATNAYSSFKSTYFATDCSGYEIRVRNNPGSNTTVSEGMGYGMLMAVYLESNSTGVSVVQGLLNFVNANLDSRGLMNWEVTCSGPAEQIVPRMVTWTSPSALLRRNTAGRETASGARLLSSSAKS